MFETMFEVTAKLLEIMSARLGMLIELLEVMANLFEMIVKMIQC